MDPRLDEQLLGAVIFEGFSLHRTVEEPAPSWRLSLTSVPREQADAISLKVLYLGLSASVTTGTHEMELILDWAGARRCMLL